MECVIDNREPRLIAILKQSIPYTVKPLDIGDISFYKDGKLILVIERKSVSDLDASIKDGRHREQKARLLASGLKSDRIIYLIEGVIKKNPTVLFGAMINTMFRDGLRVFKTVSIEETAIFIQRLYTKLESDDEGILTEFATQEISRGPMTPLEYSATLKVKKKENLTPLVWYIHQLASIPRISINIAGEIANVYPTFYSLMEAYRSQPDDTIRENLLAEIKVKTTKRNTRIGAVASKNVYMFIWGISVESTPVILSSNVGSIEKASRKSLKGVSRAPRLFTPV